MRRDEVLEILQAHKEELSRLGVKSVAIFGSVARDEARPDSDIDVLVELSRQMGLFGFLEIKDYLETLLHRRVDLATPEMLRNEYREQVLKEAIRAA